MKYITTSIIQRNSTVAWLTVLVTVLLGSSAASAEVQTSDSEQTKSRKVVMASSVEEPAASKVVAQGKTKSWSKGWHLNLEAVTNMPIDMGGRLTLEMPGRIRLSTSVGVMPIFYTDLINTIMVGAKVYDQQTALLMRSSLQNSVVWRLHLEWRPFANAGFYLGGGYGLVSLNGRLTGANIASSVGNLSISPSILNALSYNIHSTLHMLSGEIGYEFHFFRNIMSLRLAVGFTGTIASSTQIQAVVGSTVPAQIRSAAVNVGNTAATNFDNMYKSYILSPVVTIATGFRFF